MANEYELLIQESPTSAANVSVKLFDDGPKTPTTSVEAIRSLYVRGITLKIWFDANVACDSVARCC